MIFKTVCDSMMPDTGQGGGTYDRKYKTDIITTVAYLCAVTENAMQNACNSNQMTPGIYDELKENADAHIIKSLCSVRRALLFNYGRIRNERINLVPLSRMTDLIFVDDLKYLQNHGVDVEYVNVKNSTDPAIYVAYVNQYISEKIDKVRSLFPGWVNFSYIRNLFLMPDACSGHKGENLSNLQKRAAISDAVNAEKNKYCSNLSSYIYAAYLNWPTDFSESTGYSFRNDYTFLTRLYGVNGDEFTDVDKVTDVGEKKRETIYSFINAADVISIFVDCENADPYYFYSMLKSFYAESIKKIEKVFLYDDVNTTPAWDIICNELSIRVEHREYKRVMGNKSLIDVAMTAGVCKAFYAEKTDSVILVSSDSDFWGLIPSLPDARFYVINERKKTSSAIITTLNEHEIGHCYMDDFAQDLGEDFKLKVLVSALNKRIKRFNATGTMDTLDVDLLTDGIFKECRIPGTPEQVANDKKRFQSKFLKGGLLLRYVENPDGTKAFRMELNRTK
ncbi:MAG: NYN domain-containing protein [Bacteroidales bacterium]|nr:NYN domain-containing protein [Bacteroidales bacterium]